MEFIQEVKRQIEEYEVTYSQSVSDNLKKQILEEQNLRNRKNYEGHITASCYLLSPKSDKVLIVYNTNLQKYLQPGGHIEREDLNPLETAIRELKEEVGVERRLYSILSEIPLDIDTHPIPESKRKQEDRHEHHDFLYLFRLNEEVNLSINPSEIGGYSWKDIVDKNVISERRYQRIISLI